MLPTGGTVYYGHELVYKKEYLKPKPGPRTRTTTYTKSYIDVASRACTAKKMYYYVACYNFGVICSTLQVLGDPTYYRKSLNHSFIILKSGSPL